MTDPRTPRPSDPAATPDAGEGPTQPPTPDPAAPGASEPWFDDLPGDPQGPPAAAATGTSEARRQWLVAGGGAAVIAVASVVGIGVVRATADDDGDGNGDAAGGPGGGFPGGGQGIPDGGGFPGGGATGTVTGVDGSTFTVENAEGEAVTVTTSDDTTYSESVAGDLGDVEAGDDVLVMGSGDDEIEARAVVVGALDESGGPSGPDGGFPGGGGLATGTVEGVTDDGFTVDTGDGIVTVTVASDTTITVTEDATLDDVNDGDTVRISGEDGDDDSVAADGVALGDTGLGLGGGAPAGFGDRQGPGGIP